MSEGQDAEPKISAARYLASSGCVILDLSNGAIVAFPVARPPTRFAQIHPLFGASVHAGPRVGGLRALQRFC